MQALQVRIVDGISLCIANIPLSLLRLDKTQRSFDMPRDMSGTGRYPPVPKHQPTEFYGSVRLGDPERLFHVMSVDPYFLTQNNGAGAPIHFATTYKQLDMLHHLLNNGAEINQRDDNGLTALHRAAHLAQYDGYLQIYEYLLVGTIRRVN
jgi:[acyl-carrier-protein] S-malonyltransferase